MTGASSPSLTVNGGLRWDYDSRFPNKKDFSPRIGGAWQLNSKTVINASFGIFFDQFRAGVARDIPGFGGADIERERLLSFPRLFYGNPTTLTSIFQTLGRPTVCVANAMTQAQVVASGATCPNGTGSTLYGIDYLNSVVAPGHAPIPANTAVNMNNIQQLSGLTPDQFLTAADAAIANLAGSNTTLTVPPNYWSWDPFGNLTTIGGINGTAGQVPITVDPGFKVPRTYNYHVGVQRQLASDMVVTFDYYHKNIDDILTVRATNLAFEARIPGFGNELVPGTGEKKIESYGPWGKGTYDGFTLGFVKRMSHNFTIQANYTFAHAIDNVINSTLATEIQSGEGVNFLAINGLTDSFVGVPPVVTDPGDPSSGCPSQTNATHSFVACNGNPVPVAGKFYNGANLDKGPSDLALNHTFLFHGIYELPWKFEIAGSSELKAASTTASLSADGGVDVDGDGLVNGYDFQLGRNSQTAPAFVNLDLRVSKRFNIGEHLKAQILFEMFNLLNRDNAAAVETQEGITPAVGTTLQYLPGREGQFGIRLEF